MASLKDCIKKLIRFVVGEYAIYLIYRLEAHEAEAAQPSAMECRIKLATQSELETCADSSVAGQAGFCGQEAMSYVCEADGKISAVCIYWYGERYKQRNFWPLASGEAKLVQIVTSPAMRGKGVATQLVWQSAADMFERGFRCLYARIWHSNKPSRRAFEKAGWRKIARVVEINPLRRKKPWRIKSKIGGGLGL